MLRGLPGIFAALMLLLVVAGSSTEADAHADLIGAEPAVDSKLWEAPSTLALHFSQGIKEQGSFILIEDGAGTRLPLTVSFDAADRKVMRGTPVSPLPPGLYTVLWQTLSADDDDFHDGSYQLTVLNPDGSNPEGPTSSVGPEDDGGSGGTIILAGVSAAVVIVIGGLVYHLRTSRGQAA